VPTSTPPVPFPTEVHTPSLYPALTPHVLRAGDSVGRYRIDRPLGRGGMGMVFAAWDTGHNRPVAIKILGTSIPNSTLFARFQREASTAARLHHPGIVQMYGIGQTDSVCYLAMQQVNGTTLREWMGWSAGLATFGSVERPHESTPDPAWATERVDIRFDSLPTEPVVLPPPAVAPRPRPSVVSDPRYVRRVAEMLRDLADAIAHAHAAGVTHRDLKPENVMVTADGRVVVIDFGLARSFADATITTHSGLLGTPMYMAPEQLAGQPATTSSDVYALGLIGYELLAHELPFKAGTVERLLGEVLRKPAPPLSARTPAVPPELANVVHKAMAKKPGERYETAEELRADLDRFLLSERVTANGYRYRFDARELTAARPKRVALAGYTIALLGGLLGLFGLFAAVINSTPSPLLTSAFGGVFLVAAWWLLTGRRGAWACGCGVAGVLLAWVAWAVWQSLTTDLPQVPWLLIPALLGLPAASAVGLLVVLITRRSRDWFRRVRGERTEFAAEGKPRG
jgi:serine/threonine protein kinase